MEAQQLKSSRYVRHGRRNIHSLTLSDLGPIPDLIQMTTGLCDFAPGTRCMYIRLRVHALPGWYSNAAGLYHSVVRVARGRIFSLEKRSRSARIALAADCCQRLFLSLFSSFDFRHGLIRDSTILAWFKFKGTQLIHNKPAKYFAGYKGVMIPF